MRTSKKAIYFTSISIIVLLSLISLSFLGVNGNEAAAISNQSTKTHEISAGSLGVSPMVGLSGAVISAVQSGSASTSSITLGPSPDPIGANVSIDVRIDNVSVGFWGWSLPTITWNNSVMNLTKVKQGSFLSDNTGGDPTAFLGPANKDLWFQNYNGYISGGLSEGITGPDKSIDPSGVLATLTFLVIGSGNSTISIAGGNLRSNSSDLAGVNVACN